jgi:DNA-binding transcriptional LysR family regulator
MELRQMAVVVAVAEEGGFTAAARRLHVVQSAVSGTVRALEHELGARLFLRTTHRVTLTPAGRAFLSFARTALGAAEEARAAVALAQEELSGEVTVGVMQGLYAGLAPGLAAFHREHPGVAVRLRQAPADAIPRDLRDGTVDLAVVALDAARLRGLATRALAQEEMVLVTAAAEARLPERTVTLAEAVALPLVDFPLGWAIRTSVDRALRSAAVERTTAFEVNDVLGATDLVRHGLGVCILPASLAARFPDLSVRRFAAHAPTWRMRVVHPKGDLPPAVAELLRHIG